MNLMWNLVKQAAEQPGAITATGLEQAGKAVKAVGRDIATGLEPVKRDMVRRQPAGVRWQPQEGWERDSFELRDVMRAKNPTWAKLLGEPVEVAHGRPRLFAKHLVPRAGFENTTAYINDRHELADPGSGRPSVATREIGKPVPDSTPFLQHTQGGTRTTITPAMAAKLIREAANPLPTR